MAAAQEQENPGCDSGTWLACMLCCVLLPAVIATIVTLIVLSCISKDPVYSVTVTGVAGLDAAAAASSSSLLSPVFNVTVRIDNGRGRLSDAACIERLSTVAVSYGDAVLAAAGGSVPRFCAKDGKVRERRATAWGRRVDLPPFLRDQLAGELAAGEAAFDVKVTTPAMDYFRGDTVFVCSQAKIGGGPAPCRKETVYHQEQANNNPGSTG